MELFSDATLMAPASFVGGVIVGYGVRAFISARNRAAARRRRHDFP
jgi:hypothetical protein